MGVAPVSPVLIDIVGITFPLLQEIQTCIPKIDNIGNKKSYNTYNDS